jgi:Holliday junction resolvase RusA-like endonuclease
MADIYRIVVHTEPRGKGRPRFFRKGAHVGTFTDEKTQSFEAMVAAAASGVLHSHRFEGPVAVTIACDHTRPQFMMKRDRAGKLKFPGRPWFVQKPDLDNVAKAVLDGLKAWLDDKRVVSLVCDQRYTGVVELDGDVRQTTPQVRITLEELNA